MKYYLILLLFISSLFAQDRFNSSVIVSHKQSKKVILKKQKTKFTTMSRKNDDNQFLVAKKLFKNREYQKSYDIFFNLFQNNLQDPNINFYLGRSAFELKKYEQALSAYERVTIIDDKAYRAKLEMARCYQKLGMLKKAKTMLLSVREKVPTSVRKNIDLYLSVIEAKRKKHSFGGAIILGVNYDSNIYSVTVDNALSDKISGLKLNNAAANGWAHQEVVAANYAYAKTTTFKYKVDTLFFNKTIFNYHDMDLKLVMLTPAISLKYSKKLSVDYALFANKVWLSTKQLMMNYGLNPKFTYIYSPTLALKGALKYQVQQNNPPNRNRDNSTYSIELSAIQKRTKKLSLLVKTRFDVVREKHSGEKGDLNEVAYNLSELTFGTKYKYSKKIILASKAKAYKKDYIDKSIAPITKLKLYERSDKEYQLSINGTYIYSPKMLFTLEYAHTIHDSNYVDSRFYKDTVATNAIILF